MVGSDLGNLNYLHTLGNVFIGQLNATGLEKIASVSRANRRR